MKKIINETGETGKMGEIGEKFRSRLKQICGRPSPAKRLVVVLFFCAVFAAGNIYFLVIAFSGIGKYEKDRELMKLEHIEALELPKKESIHILESIEYDEQSSERE